MQGTCVTCLELENLVICRTGHIFWVGREWRGGNSVPFLSARRYPALEFSLENLGYDQSFGSALNQSGGASACTGRKLLLLEEKISGFFPGHKEIGSCGPGLK